MDTLTKMMAVFIKNDGDWAELFGTFLFKFDSTNLESDRRAFSSIAISTFQKKKMMLKGFLEEGIFKKIDSVKDQPQYKILYLTKLVNSYDVRALKHVDRKMREVALQASKLDRKEEKAKKR